MLISLFNGHGIQWTPGVGDEQGGLACCSSWGQKELDATERLDWTELLCLLRWQLDSLPLVPPGKPHLERKKKLRISELIHGVTSKMDRKDLESGAQWKFSLNRGKGHSSSERTKETDICWLLRELRADLLSCLWRSIPLYMRATSLLRPLSTGP